MSGLLRVRKKPVVVEAVQFTGEETPHSFIFNWLPFYGYDLTNRRLAVPTLEGTMLANPGDYIIKGVRGEFYPCKKDVFEETYEVVPEDGN